MNDKHKTAISDWGIEETVSSPVVSGHFHALRFFNESIFSSYHSHTNSVVSTQSHQNDSVTDTTSLASPIIAKDEYHEFLDDYSVGILLKDSHSRKDSLCILNVGRTSLIREKRIIVDVLDRFNYTIITSDLLQNDNKLKYIRHTHLATNEITNEKAPWNMIALTGYSIKVQSPRLKIVWLLISMMRYLLRHAGPPLLFRLMVFVLIKQYSEINLCGIRLKAHKTMKLLDQFMDNSVALDNKLISAAKAIGVHDRFGDLQKDIAVQLGAAKSGGNLSASKFTMMKSGISLLILQYNGLVKKMLPYMDIICLEKYLEVYKLDFYNKELDFIWIINHCDYEESQTPEDLTTLIRSYVIIRKFYLCCLLTLGECGEVITSPDNGFFSQLLETKFNVKVEKIYVSPYHKLDKIIESLEISRALFSLNEQLQDLDSQPVDGAFDISLFEFEKDPYDKFISRMDKISNNLKYLRYKGVELQYEKQIANDLSNLVQLYNNLSHSRSMSNPFELKRYSMSSIPKRRIMVSSATTTFNSHNQHTADSSNKRRSSNGLSFNLLTAVLEDETVRENKIYYEHDVGNKVSNNIKDRENSVIIHEMAHSTMLDNIVIPKIGSQIIANPGTGDDAEEEEEEEEEGDDDNDDVMTQEEMQAKLNSTLNKVYR